MHDREAERLVQVLRGNRHHVRHLRRSGPLFLCQRRDAGDHFHGDGGRLHRHRVRHIRTGIPLVTRGPGDPVPLPRVSHWTQLPR
jgi:hypothetical protein